MLRLLRLVRIVRAIKLRRGFVAVQDTEEGMPKMLLHALKGSQVQELFSEHSLYIVLLLSQR